MQTANITVDFVTFLSEIDRLPIDQESIAQERLDLVNRYRTSLFPWRGQFSPELIEILLTKYASKESVIVDPFVGSGTTLFEAARKSLSCFGAEIHPAAVEMASAVHFVNIEIPERKDHIRKARAIIDKYIPVHHGTELYKGNKQSLKALLQEMLHEADHIPLVHNIITNTIIRYMAFCDKIDPLAFFNAFTQIKAIIENLPYNNKLCRVYLCDARTLPLDDESIDLIVTSPPYINVFNYHQNYRKAMELMGWNLLSVAKSEFGSNRKNRGNRFLTVVQYMIDMLQALVEMRRLVHSDGRIIIVIGRESQVRGISFQNGRILAALAVGGAGLRLALRQERKFKNKFGETIYEDLLHFVPAVKPHQVSDDFARSLAQHALDEAAKNAPDNVRNDILAAGKAAIVQPSPYFDCTHSKVLNKK